MSNTILVVEDNPDNMALVVEILEDAEFEVIQAERAEDGIEKLYQGKINLVLMDISLPTMGGLEAIRIIKTDKVLKNIPIVGLSAHAMKSDRDAAMSAGCNEYQTKPIDEEALLSTIKRLIE